MSQVPPTNPYQGTGYDPGFGDPVGVARAQVSGPAIGLMVAAGIGGALQVLGLLLNLLTTGMSVAGAGGGNGPDASMAILTGTASIVSGMVGIVVAGVIIFGALKMKSLENYTLSMVASILAMVPCISPCCLIGLPIGIWALVVLNRPEVKGAFRT